MAKETKTRFLIFKDGTEKEITDENGKYWICGDTQYRKANPDIVKIKKESVKEDVHAKKQATKKKEDTKEFDKGFDKIPETDDII